MIGNIEMIKMLSLLFFYSEIQKIRLRQIIKLLESNVGMWSGKKLISFH